MTARMHSDFNFVSKGVEGMVSRGRAKLSRVERKRRAALRQKIKAEELQQYFDAVGDNKDEIERMSGPGRRPKPLSYRVEEAWSLLEEMKSEVRALEEAEGLEHVDVEDVHDPLVEKGTVHAVGRKAKDEFTVLDQDLLKSERKLAVVYQEWSEAGTDQPERAIVDGRPKGRKPTPYPERVNHLLLEIEGIQLEIKKREEKLSKTELMQRQLKILRDFARTVKNALKKNEIEPERGQSLLSRTDAQIKSYAEIVDRMTRQKEELPKDLESIRNEMSRPSLFSDVIRAAERKLSETDNFERKNAVSKELRERSEMLDYMIAMQNKKKQLIETRREIAKLEKELAELQSKKEKH